MSRLEQALLALILLASVAGMAWFFGEASGNKSAKQACLLKIKTITEAASTAQTEQASKTLTKERAAAASYAANLTRYEETQREDARRIAALRTGRSSVYHIPAASCTAAADLPAVAADPRPTATFWAELPPAIAADLESIAADADRELALCLDTLKSDRGMP